MRARTARWDTAIRASHQQLVVEVDVLLAGQVVVEGLAVAAGSVTIDRGASVRGRCSGVTLAEPARVPAATGGVLSPLGYELAVRRGIRYADGITELMPLGVFGIQSTSSQAVTLSTSVEGMDRSQKVREARFEDDYQVPAGTNYATAIRDVIDQALPGLTFLFSSTSFTTPLLTFEALSDPWDAASSMARSIGCEVLFDGTGACVLRPEPSWDGAPVWTIAEGAGGVLVDAELRLDRGPSYNRVVATGENADNGEVFRGVATDDDPSSPTYYFGPFGKKPRGYASPFIASDAQAASAAAAILRGNIGIARSLNVRAVPNPALEAGDLITVTRASLGVDEVHIADAVRFDLGAAGVMSIESRARQVAA